MTNPYGDVELDAAGMRALAHPVRIAVLQRLRTAGPATATQLSEVVEASPSVISWHLRHLAAYELVVDAPELSRGRQRFWRAGSGFRFSVQDEISRDAANQLQDLLSTAAGDVLGTWRREVEPTLEPVWRERAGSQDTTVTLTPDELATINSEVERLLAPFVSRRARPEGARPVRILRHVLPEGPR